MPGDKITLREERTPDDFRSLVAFVNDEGDFVIQGHDLGKGVNEVFGRDEYEWDLTVAAENVPAVAVALGAPSGTPILDAVRVWIAVNPPDDLEMLLRDREIPTQLWSRIGD